MIVGKLQLVDNIKRDIPDNSTGQVSPRDVRQNLLNIIDSVHLFTDDNDLTALNFATPDTRTTRAGQDAIGNMHLQGYSSEDNSAFGYSALSDNYDGVRNTAIGSHSMGCNLYGDSNTAIGFNSLAGNVFGSGNVALGNFSLQRSKFGSFNVAIGHGAGYYVGNYDKYKLYIGSHNIDEESTCDNPLGSGLIPLMYGDMQGLKLGIATSGLHNYGALQVSGNISPSQDCQHNLGHSSYRWSDLYLCNSINESIHFSGDYVGFGANPPSGQGLVTVAGHLVPSLHDTYALGHPELRWDGYFNDITVSGTANIQNAVYTTVEDCTYHCRTLYLASSGLCDDMGGWAPPCGYLHDEQIEGGGFVLQSSGLNYRRDYEFVFTAPDTTLTSLEEDTSYSRSAWNSNISIHVASGSHIKTDRTIGRENLSLLSDHFGYGIFMKKDTDGARGRNVMYITEEDNITPNPLTVDGTLSNITDVNFISASGDEEYVITYAGLGSGITVGQHIVSRTSRDPKDDKTIGFHVDYKDENDVVDGETGQKKDRMFISAYDNATTAAGALTIMRSTDPGFVGINDVAETAELILPETIFNIQSTGDAVTRITSSTALHKASVQLLNPSNSLDEGFEIEYSQSTARADMSMFKSMDKKTVISIDRDTNKIGLHTVSPNELLTLSKDITGTATISMEEQSSDPSSTSDYGKVYVKPVADNASQTQSLYFEDDTGNIFDLIFNPSVDYRMVYSDDSCNTYIGQTPDRRDDIDSSNNTGLGGGALYNILTGDRNTSVGCNAGMSLTTGDDNLFLGYRAGQDVITGSDNIILGYHSVPCGANLQSNIFIGKNLSLGICADYEFFLGYNNPLLYGKLGPNLTDRHLYLHKEAPLSFESNSQNDLLTIRPKTTSTDGVESWFEKVESVGNNHPEGTIDFLFTSKELDGTAIMTEKKLLTLSHYAAAMTNSCSYQVSDPARPMATLKGDLNIQGTINFCDGTSLDSSDGLVYAPGSGINSSVNVSTGNTEFNIDIEELTFAESLSGPDTHLAVSNNNILRKVNIDALSDIISSGEARIVDCDSGDGQNHVFTNNSTIEETTCYTSFLGSRAGDHASNTTASNFIGYQAGSHAVGVSANAVDNCNYSTFMGYMAGYEVQNAEYSVFIGSSAGYQADNSRFAVFIGDSAGTSAASERSIGIGDNALENVTGIYNIEFTTGIGGDHRLFGQGEISNALAIGTCIAGDMEDKKVSLGDARINPDAVLEVKAFLSATDYLQEWKNSDDEVVARLTKDGNLYIKGSVTELYSF